MSQNDLFLSILLLAILVVAARLIVERAVRHWKRELSDLAGPGRAHLDGERHTLAGAARATADVSADDPPPYGPLAAQLHQALAEAQDVHHRLARQRTNLLRRVPSRPASRLGGVWFAAVREPYCWWQIHRAAVQIGAGHAPVAPEIEPLLSELQNLPVATAGRCHHAREAAVLAVHIAAALRQAGAHGANLDRSAAAVRHLEAELDALPARFVQGGGTAVPSAVRQDVIQAWQVLARIEEPLDEQLARLGRWQAELAAVRQQAAALPAAVEQAAQAVGGLPAAVDAADLAADLIALRAEAVELAAACATPQVDDLEELSQALSVAVGRAAGLAGHVLSLHQQLNRLRSILPGAVTLLAEVETRMEDLSLEAVLPLQWGVYHDNVAWLRLVEARIGPAGLQRTPAQLREHARLAEKLLEDTRSLQRQVGEIAVLREALIDLVNRSDLSTSATWLSEARALAQAIRPYHAANWPAELAAGHLSDDAEVLWRRLRDLLPEAGERLKADGLAERLANLQQVAGDIGPFRQRVARLAAEFARLQAAEQAARDGLEPLHAAFADVAGRLHDNRPALEPIVTQHERRLRGLQREGQAVLDSLQQPGSGRVADKARQATRWEARAQRALADVHQALLDGLDQSRAQIQERLAALKAYARLDGEPAVQQARALLAAPRGPAQPAHRRGADRHAEAILFLAAGARRLLGEALESRGVLETLQARVAQPLREPLTALDHARSQATDHVTRLGGLARDLAAAWPPLSCDDSRIARRLESATRHHDELRSQSDTVSDVLWRATQLAGQYQELVANANEMERQARRDQERLQGLAGRLEAWQAQLAAYRTAHEDDPGVAAAIDDRLAQVSREVRRLRGHWQGRPPRADEAQRALEQLLSAAREDLAPRGGSRLRARDIEAGGR